MISSYLNPIPSLPKPLGPHKVGTVEWEIPVSEIPSSSPTPDSRISTIKFRIFYPTTQSASSKVSVPWLPHPQRTWQQAYASFLGAKPRLSSFISYLPFTIHYTNLPVVAEAPLLPRDKSTKYPLTIFSHGLGGNFNTYSSVCTSLASFGIVCIAPEHRDGSAPVSLIRSEDGSATSIPYQKHAHSPTAEVLNSRNAQLRIRLWELDQIYTAITCLNAGKSFTNYASPEKGKASEQPALEDTLDLQPGRVSWVGHSFGAATMVQFIKSVYYHESLPSLKGTPYENDLDWRPLYKPASNSDLVRQITPESPVGLLDLWTMPLRGEQTQWLWERPLPCYERKPSEKGDNTTTNVVAIVTAEFHKYTDLLNRMKAALSAKPAEAMEAFDRERPRPNPTFNNATLATPPNKAAFEPELDTEATLNQDAEGSSDGTSDIDKLTPLSSASQSPALSRASSPSPSGTSDHSASTSMTSFAPSSEAADRMAPKLFLIPESAHLSQSDFGVLFPNLTRYLMKAQEPVETINLNVRAVLAAMRGVGLEIEAYRTGEDSEAEIDTILTDRCVEKRFVPVSLQHD
ncbi:hypothetical protein LTR92_008490 [Exophiala xenobiotica]|nr:hypothetical protein LTR92_008490 [Exophiala xenobiotica]KAK5290505.1 hypothetical protein LTR14_006809 [Exophiala xenobiotica]KAK5428848.1 hypothetical protein LTR34_008015 [Exophiala xenobiotica]